MTNPNGVPDRAKLVRTTRKPTRREDVIDAIVHFTTTGGTHVHVERFEDGCRWSPAHRGGGYPLLRAVARFLGADHRRITVPFRTVGDGWTVLSPDDDALDGAPLSTAMLTFQAPASRVDIDRELTRAFPDV